MDAFSKILELVKLKGVIYDKVTVRAPWGVNVPAAPHAMLRIVAEGGGVLKMEGRKLIRLDAGDVVIFPHGEAHWIADSENSPRLHGPAVLAALRAGEPVFSQSGAATSFVIGHFEFDSNSSHPFIKNLPFVIYLKNAGFRECSAMKPLVELIMAEASADRMGSRLIVNRMAEALFIQAIRAYIELPETKKGFLAALEDGHISKVLAAIHLFPEREWTLFMFAKEAGLSRTLFVNRFKDFVGETPMQYLTTWRILKAKELLSIKKDPIREIARTVGYESESAFNRVFKKRALQTPAEFRRLAASRQN